MKKMHLGQVTVTIAAKACVYTMVVVIVRSQQSQVGMLKDAQILPWTLIQYHLNSLSVRKSKKELTNGNSIKFSYVNVEILHLKPQ